MIAGSPQNPAGVVRTLEDKIRAQTKGWRSLAKYQNMNSTELLQGRHGILMNAPESACVAVMPLLIEHKAKPYYSPGEPRIRGEGQRLLRLGNSFLIAGEFSFVLLN